MLHLVDSPLDDDDDALRFLALQQKDLTPVVGFRFYQRCHLFNHEFRDGLEGTQVVDVAEQDLLGLFIPITTCKYF